MHLLTVRARHGVRDCLQARPGVQQRVPQVRLPRQRPRLRLRVRRRIQVPHRVRAPAQRRRQEVCTVVKFTMNKTVKLPISESRCFDNHCNE